MIRDRLGREFAALRKVAAGLDRQTVVVLVSAAVLVILQMKFGDRAFFRRHFGAAFEAPWRELFAWAWWFTVQGILGFVVPVVILVAGFRRRPSEIGLGRGDVRLGAALMAAYLPLVIVGTWFLSDGDAFLTSYPHHAPAATDWTQFLLYQAFFLLYWIGWEYLWRGFVLFGTAPRFGVYAVFVQAMPFAILHFNKPMPEALLSVVGGVALGALVWRCRSFWIAVPIHAAQMIILDLWCTLRIRTGVRGVGLDDLVRVLAGGGG